MRYLSEYAGREEVSAVIDRAMGFDIVHGVVVRLDPTWLGLWRLSHALSRAEWETLDKDLLYMADWYRNVLGPPWPRRMARYLGLTGLLDSGNFSPISPVAIDPKWSCGTWEEIADRHHQGRREPFIIQVLVVPRSPRGTFDELISSLGEGREQIRFEARPVARAYSGGRKKRVQPLQGGISVGSATGDYATLGGILRDGSGKFYALTCGHAIARNAEAKQPSPKDKQTSARIGICIESTDGALQGPTKSCNRKKATNEVDAALIELDGNLQPAPRLELMGVGKLAGWAAIDDVNEDSPIQVSGRSGLKNVYTGGLLVIGSLRIGPDRFCFRNLMEIKRASVQYWGATGTLAPPVRPGDSGAWVVQDGPNGPEWCGMVVGGAGPIGYAVFAENIFDWLKTKHHSGLSVA